MRPSRVARRPHDLEPALGEQARQALAQEDGVVGDHDAHGIVTTMFVPPPGGVSRQERAVDGGDPVDEPAEARAIDVRAANAVVGDLEPRTGRRRRQARSGRRGPRVLGDVGQGLGGDEIGGDLDARRQATHRAPGPRRPAPATGRPATGRPHRAPPRGGSPGPGPARARGARRSPPDLVGRGVKLGRDAVGGPSPRRVRIVRSETASARSRCWAPSCRSRSTRRRSASAASTIRVRDARDLVELRAEVVLEPLVVDREAHDGA